MIEIAPHTALMLYLTFALFGIVAVWLFHHFCQSKRELKTFEKILITCEYCSNVYLSQVEDLFPECPSCHSLNRTCDLKSPMRKKKG